MLLLVKLDEISVLDISQGSFKMNAIIQPPKSIQKSN